MFPYLLEEDKKKLIIESIVFVAFFVATFLMWIYLYAQMNPASSCEGGNVTVIVVTGICFFTFLCYSLFLGLRYVYRMTQVPLSERNRYEQLDSMRSVSSKAIDAIAKYSFVIIGFILVGAIWTGSIWLMFMRSNANNMYDGVIDVKGLSAPVKIFREPNGMIHINATNENDMYFAQGYVTAQERLYQLDSARRLFRGRLAEVLGRSAVSYDIFTRRLGLEAAADSALAGLSPATRATIRAFIAGINTYIEHASHLPVEFQVLGYRPTFFEEKDVIGIVKILHQSTAFNSALEIKRYNLLMQGIPLQRIEALYPDYPANAPTTLSAADLLVAGVANEHSLDELQVLANKLKMQKSGQRTVLSEEETSDYEAKDPFEQLNGLYAYNSNGWVIHGSLTKSGKPLLANDPHLQLSAPNSWMLMHIQSPTINVIGASYPGIPGILSGRTDKLAWGITNACVDVQDYYILTDNKEYEMYTYQNIAMPYNPKNSTILIRDEPALNVTVRKTVFGPVIHEIKGKKLALRWTGLDKDDSTLDGILALQRANDWTQFSAAIEKITGPTLNVLYADTVGNIAYQLIGNVPIRAANHNGRYPVEGKDDTFVWLGVIPKNRMPKTLNPQQQFIVNANNKITPTSYQFNLGSDFATPQRAIRITNMIRALTKATNDLKANIAIQLDDFSEHANQFIDTGIIAKLENPTNDPEVNHWKQQLLKWNRKLSNSQEATIFEFWFESMKKLTDPMVNGTHSAQPLFIYHVLANGDQLCNGSCISYASKQFAETIRYLHSNFGYIPRWGSEIHNAYYGTVFESSVLQCFAARKTPSYGGLDTVATSPLTRDNGDSTWGVTYRQVIDLSNMEASKFAIPLGQSGTLFSYFYDNFLHDFSEGKYLDMKTSRYTTQHTLTLYPLKL